MTWGISDQAILKIAAAISAAQWSNPEVSLSDDEDIVLYAQDLYRAIINRDRKLDTEKP